MNCSRRQNLQQFQNCIIPAQANRKVEYVAEVPKPMVPDLSMIDDPFSSVTVSKATAQSYRYPGTNNKPLPGTNKPSYPPFTSPSLITPSSDKLQQSEKQKTTHDEEKNKNASLSSYDAWRIKNADLFSKSVTTKTIERSDRIADNVNAQLHQNIETNRQQIMNFDEIQRTENLNLRRSVEGDEDDVRRVKELYNKVFPSDRHIQSQYNRKCVDINDKIIPYQSTVLNSTSPILNDQHNCKFTTIAHGNPRKDIIVKKSYDNNNYDELIRSKSVKYNQPVCVRQLSQNMTRHNSLIDEHDDNNDYHVKCLSTYRNRDDNSINRLSIDEHNVTSKCNCNDVCQNTKKELISNYNTSNRYRCCCPNRECFDSNRMDRSNNETIQKRKKKNITVDELYNVVKLQNEQINLLQKQIDRLLSEQQKFSKSKHDVNRSAQICDNSLHRTSIGNSQHDKFTAQGIFKAFSVVQEQNSTCHQNGRDNIMESNRTNVSIGVMTSFVAELGVTTQQYRVADLNQNQVQSNCDDNQPKNSKNDEINIQDSSCKCHSNSTNELQHRFPTSNKKDVDRNQCKNTLEQIAPAKQRGFSGSLENFNRRKQVRERGNGCPVVTEEESFAGTDVDLPTLSLSLPAVAVREHIPSPQCSLHIDIQDFDSNSTVSTPSSVSNSPSPSHSDYEDNCENGVGNEAGGYEEEEDQGRGRGRVGWTFYDNVVGQVNKILEGTAPRSNTNQIAQQERPLKQHPSSAMGIAENTHVAKSVQQIRQRGISFIPEEKEDEPEEEYYNNNVSSATAKKVTFNSNNEREKDPLVVNGKQSTSPFTFSDEQQILQAAMDIMRRRAGGGGGDMRMEKEKEMIRPPPPLPPQRQLETSPDLAAGGLLSDLSFATIQYLKRYQLLPQQQQQQQQAVQSCDKQQRFRQQPSPPLKFLPSELHCEPHRIQDRRENFNRTDVPPFTGRVMREQQPPIHNEQYNYHQIMQPANKILDITALKQQPKLL